MFVAIALVLAGCGGSAEAPSSIASAEDSAPADVGTAADANLEETSSPSYPSGPYGTAVGDVVADLELVGYVREATTGLATESTYGAVKLGDLRARVTVKYAVLHVGGFT